ncbi:hypothetical protein JB92DRAFT_791932 [Gautieria morchelliformis]|nr:hypothetical protein JB92DRAFT_791932 [Gautieria morchelliformis]
MHLTLVLLVGHLPSLSFDIAVMVVKLKHMLWIILVQKASFVRIPYPSCAAREGSSPRKSMQCLLTGCRRPLVLPVGHLRSFRNELKPCAQTVLYSVVG